MKKVIFLLCILLVSLPILGQSRQPSGEKHRIVAYAQQFLMDQGFDPQKLQLRFEKVTPNLVFFDNPESRLFILVARDKVAPLLHERILAFSMGATWAEGVDDSGIEKIFHYYDSTLTKMAAGKIPAEINFPRFQPHKNVSALLKDIKWRQFRFPMHCGYPMQGCLTGCGPTAMAQIMKFHRYPADSIDWETTRASYPYLTSDTLSIVPLLARIGRCAKAEYGVKGTRSSMEDLRHALIRNFGYSTRMYHAYHQVKECDLLQWVETDISEGRPSLLCGFDHLFVCDGVCNDFFHLNMGWGGNYDGWYRFITPQAYTQQESLLDGALVNIVPLDASDTICHDLSFEQAGGLASLPITQLKDIARLKLSGPINGADLNVLRHMAGSMMNDTIRGWHGRLSELDLSEASIVADSPYYFNYIASENGLWITWNGKEYDFSHMTHKKWMEIADAPATHNSHYDVVEEEPGAVYRVYLKTEDDVVGSSLFYSCQNLRKLMLPRSTERIGRYAFFFCPMLESVTMPDLDIINTNRKDYFSAECQILIYPEE